MYDQIQKYAYFTMIVCVVSVLLTVSSMMPITQNIGTDTYTNMQTISTSWNTLSSTFENADSITDYVAFGILLLKQGILIVLNIILLYFNGSTAIFQLFYIPSLIYAPIVILVNIIIIYDIGKLLLNRG